MGWQNNFNRWITHGQLDNELKEQLEANKNDEKWLEDCFYKNLEFGTGGMRGELGPGTNRINVYTIRKASEGLALYIKETGGTRAMNAGVAIAYDSRYKSYEFAIEAAKTLGYHNIKTYVFENLRPTPELSFAVRELNAFAGIVITASHNPPEYNGYKVYGEDGGQLTPLVADQVIAEVNSIENELEVAIADEKELVEKGLLTFISNEIDTAYIEKVKTISLRPQLFSSNSVRTIFTPLHGTSALPIQLAFKEMGYENYCFVKEQVEPDPSYSTVAYPNPEEEAAFDLAIKYGKEQNADLLIATDPDADRLGIAVKNNDGKYIILTGNQTGGLFLEYLLSTRKEIGQLPANGVVLKTIVTSEIGRTIASAYGLETIDTLTGFKFIGEKIKEYEENQTYTFQFGYEESYGYLIKDFVRDKDAIQAALLAVEIAAFYKDKGMTLYEGLMNLFETYGYFMEDLHSITLKGKEGLEQISKVMEHFRLSPPTQLNETHISIIEDYLKQERIFVKDKGAIDKLELPKSNVLKFHMEDGGWVCLRPSGTEPKLKLYFGIKGSTFEDAKSMLENVKANMIQLVNEAL